MASTSIFVVVPAGHILGHDPVILETNDRVSWPGYGYAQTIETVTLYWPMGDSNNDSNAGGELGDFIGTLGHARLQIWNLPMFCRLHTARSHLSSLHMQPMNAKSPVQNSLETKTSDYSGQHVVVRSLH